MEKFMILLVENLRRLLQETGLTIREIEKKSSLKSGALQNILSGKSINPTIKTITAIATALDTSIDDLVGLKIDFEKKIQANEAFLPALTPSNIKHFLQCCSIMNDILINIKTEIEINKFISLSYEIFHFSFSSRHKFNMMASPLFNRFIQNLLIKEGITKEDSFKDEMLSSLTLSKSILTERESQVLFSLVMGLSSKEIARDLNLSSRTIESFIKNIKNKTGIYLKSDLISFFYNELK